MAATRRAPPPTDRRRPLARWSRATEALAQLEHHGRPGAALVAAEAPASRSRMARLPADAGSSGMDAKAVAGATGVTGIRTADAKGARAAGMPAGSSHHGSVARDVPSEGETRPAWAGALSARRARWRRTARGRPARMDRAMGRSRAEARGKMQAGPQAGSHRLPRRPPEGDAGGGKDVGGGPRLKRLSIRAGRGRRAHAQACECLARSSWWQIAREQKLMEASLEPSLPASFGTEEEDA